jgi:hypothetical protein
MTCLGTKGAAFTAYALYQNTDYGKDYRLGTTYETGSMVHVGYVIPGKSKHVFNLMFYDERQIDALNDNASQLGKALMHFQRT